MVGWAPSNMQKPADVRITPRVTGFTLAAIRVGIDKVPSLIMIDALSTIPVQKRMHIASSKRILGGVNS